MITQKRLAASILKCSPGKVWLDPEARDEIKEAITRIDIKSLILKGLIKKKKISEQSKVRARIIKIQKRKGNKRNQGSRKGKANARLPQKRKWIATIRAQREFLNTLRKKSLIELKSYGRLYSLCKGGFFRSKRHLKVYVEENKIIINKADQKK